MLCTNVNKTASPGLWICLVFQAFDKSKWEVSLAQAPPVPQETWVMRSMSSVPAGANSVARVAVCLLKQAWSPVLEDCS